MIYEFKHQLLIGKPCIIHEGFTSAMTLFCKLLALNDLKYHNNCSYDPNHLSLTPAEGAIVKPASHGDHLIGHATDGNLIDKTGKTWTSEMLHPYCQHSKQYDINAEKNDVYQFLKSIRSSNVLRWGGDFVDFDPVHFDDALYQMNPARWQQIYNELFPEK